MHERKDRLDLYSNLPRLQDPLGCFERILQNGIECRIGWWVYDAPNP
jgi:hypothetical protein